MTYYQWFSILALGVCVISAAWHFIRLVRLGKPEDFSLASGKEIPAIVYSFTGAMSPAKKESAFLHLPTYSAGMIYHLGTFAAIAIFFLELAGLISQTGIFYAGAFMLLLSFGCGVGIFIKRLVKPGLRKLSSPDDYISNILVTLFQLSAAIVIMIPSTAPVYYLLAGLLALYFPLGKLKHAVYFFAARYHLGIFYGHRNVWPPKPL
ncbi:MAG: hypothetical protein NT004_05245 [Bacteroidetes bacterium]|nr:hypothetical protein [Bacteroidota bacterium]